MAVNTHLDGFDQFLANQANNYATLFNAQQQLMQQNQMAQ